MTREQLNEAKKDFLLQAAIDDGHGEVKAFLVANDEYDNLPICHCCPAPGGVRVRKEGEVCRLCRSEVVAQCQDCHMTWDDGAEFDEMTVYAARGTVFSGHTPSILVARTCECGGHAIARMAGADYVPMSEWGR